MRIVAVIAASVSILAVAGTATNADAQSRGRAPAVNLADVAAQSPSTPAATQRRGLRWNENGRWGLNFNLNQPVGREADWGDVEAGAYYRLSPRLRVGAAANLASPEVDPARVPESSDRRAAPRVRLESVFKF